MKKPIEKVSGRSYSPQQEFLDLLKKQSPEIFSEGKVDCQKLKQTLGEEVNLESERYGLTWAGKSDCFGIIQEPTTATLTPDKKESVNFEQTENLFIEGDNLEVLKVLQKSYYGKIKMIYIDPPYNTGSDFIYKDNFKSGKADYEKQAGIKDEEGNIQSDRFLIKNMRDSGHFHSNWLNLMYPRLFLARNLLKQDGVIFVSIDDNEVQNLRMIMDEIFGEENFIGDIIWNSTKSVTNTALISVSHTYNLVYARDIDYYIKNRSEFRLPENGEGFDNPDKDPRGSWKADPFQVGGWRPNQQYEIKNPKTGEIYKPNKGCSWKNDYKKYKELLNDNRIVFGVSGEAGPQRKRFLSEAEERGRVTTTIWNDLGTTTTGTQLLKKILGDSFFDNPKPIDLIQRFCKLCTKGDDIIFDFFAGSGTTAHAIMALNAEDGENRKCISIQLPELTDKESEAYKAGYKNIADITKERIRRAGKKIKEEVEREMSLRNGVVDLGLGKDKELEIKKVPDIGFKAYRLDESNFKIWRTDIKDEKELLKQMDMFVDNLKKGSQEENVLFELILKSGLDLNIRIEKKKVESWEYYVIEDNKLVIYLGDKISKKLIDDILKNPPEKFICLDKSFANNDQLKTNTILQMESVKVDFKVI